MTIEEFNKYAATKLKEFEELANRDFPIKVGAMAQRHFEDNFYKSGFVNDGLKPWQRSKRQSGSSAYARRGTLIGGANANLMGGIKYIPNGNKVTVFNKVPYAPTHNWGETIHPTVTPKMRRFAWAKYFQAIGAPPKGVSRKVAAPKPLKGRIKKGSSVFTPKNISLNKEALMWKGLALTKKEKLSIKMPQRQFLGESKELNDKIREKLQTELEKVLNS